MSSVTETETVSIPRILTQTGVSKNFVNGAPSLQVVDERPMTDGSDSAYNSTGKGRQEMANPTIRSSPLISERPIDQPRPLKVIYIGAGASGIIAGIQFRKAVPDIDLVIYEKNPDLGGTWYENKYPGCACDVPSHAYQLSFESWTEWSHFFSGADEILEYWKRVAQKYDVQKHVRFNNRCIGARWNDTNKKWFVKMQDVETGETFEDSADVFMTGTGQLNEWKWPEIPGLLDFEGTLLHSANWNEHFNAEGKRVAVIGAGSSGIQIVPALLDKVSVMDHYVRGRMWISNQFGGEEFRTRTKDKGGNFAYSDEEKQAWQKDPESYVRYRKQLEFEMQTFYAKSQRGSKLQQDARNQYTADMQQRLAAKPELLDQLLPDFPPLCKRLNPGPGYLEALTSPKVNVIKTGISSVNKTGIITADGVHHPVDAIVCATGFDTSPGSGFPILGRHGLNLRERYAHRPETYLGLCTVDFPNFFQSLGPHLFQGAGNLLIMIEYVHKYVAQVLTKMAFSNVGIVEPKRHQVENFTRFTEEYFERTVYSAECSSWYKSSPPGASWEERLRGRVTAIWPGSSLHAIKTFENVRWEDFEIAPYDGNDFGWFGNGWTVGEKRPTDLEPVSWYLNKTEFLEDNVVKESQ